MILLLLAFYEARLNVGVSLACLLSGAMMFVSLIVDAEKQEKNYYVK